MFTFFITEGHTLHFLDVRETYFDAYRAVMNPFFKDPNGLICDYKVMKKKAVYKQPFYSEGDKNKVSDEGRKLLLRTNADLSDIRRLLKSYHRTAVQVNLIQKMYK